MQVPIVFCADANYGRYLPVAVQSIIENSSAEHEYQIIIFDCGIRAADLAVLERQRLPASRIFACGWNMFKTVSKPCHF